MSVLAALEPYAACVLAFGSLDDGFKLAWQTFKQNAAFEVPMMPLRGAHRTAFWDWLLNLRPQDIERELEVNAEHIKKSMIEQNVLVEKLAEVLPESIDQEQLSRLLEQCQNRIKRLGAINLVAIEEYKLQQERKAFLDLQHDEVIDALDSLEQAMQKIDKEFPHYYWKQNKGYPTKQHRNAIRAFGITNYHRKTFRLLPNQLKLEL